jgi:hypothetical protein
MPPPLTTAEQIGTELDVAVESTDNQWRNMLHKTNAKFTAELVSVGITNRYMWLTRSLLKKLTQTKRQPGKAAVKKSSMIKNLQYGLMFYLFPTIIPAIFFKFLIVFQSTLIGFSV